MVAIPFPISSSPGERPHDGAGRLVNAYAIKNEQGARFPVRWVRSPGLRQVAEATGQAHFRGGILVSGNVLVGVFDDVVYAITKPANSYVLVQLGSLPGSEPVTIAKNNAATPDIVAVTGEGAKTLYTDAAPIDFADADLPEPNSVSELNGYFLWTIGNGRIFASQLNSPSVATNSFTTEQSLDGLLRGVTFRGEFYAFGAKGTAVYQDVGASPFPLQRQSFTIQRGIIGTHAVAGWEPSGPDELLWVGDDALVYRMNGYTPELVSNDAVGRVLGEALRAGEGPSLEAATYTAGQQRFWTITNPGKWTWEYCLTSQNWNERESFGRDDWRASRAVRAFDQWIAGDRTTGKLFAIDPTYYREANDPLVWKVRSGVAAAYPNRTMVPRAEFDIIAGVGVADGEADVETDPTALIRWSNDGGYKFGNPVSRRLGKQGEARHTVSVNGLGIAGPKGKVFEVAISDPVYVSFQGGDLPGLEVRP